MKAFERNLRKITVNNTVFRWIITETSEFFKLRCYNMKSTYVDVYFKWEDYHEVNLNKPSVVEAIIKYAISEGWEYELENKTMVMDVGSQYFIDDL